MSISTAEPRRDARSKGSSWALTSRGPAPSPQTGPMTVKDRGKELRETSLIKRMDFEEERAKVGLGARSNRDINIVRVTFCQEVSLESAASASPRRRARMTSISI